MENNLKILENIKSFKGGDNRDVPINPKSIEDMITLVRLCHQHNLPQPEVFPHSGGDGVQAEWTYDWYLEIDSDSRGISFFFVNKNDYDNPIEGRFDDITNAFLLIREFLKHIVD
jgi:hypothetical protein